MMKRMLALLVLSASLATASANYSDAKKQIEDGTNEIIQGWTTLTRGLWDAHIKGAKFEANFYADSADWKRIGDLTDSQLVSEMKKKTKPVVDQFKKLAEDFEKSSKKDLATATAGEAKLAKGYVMMSALALTDNKAKEYLGKTQPDISATIEKKFANENARLVKYLTNVGSASDKAKADEASKCYTKREENQKAADPKTTNPDAPSTAVLQFEIDKLSQSGSSYLVECISTAKGFRGMLAMRSDYATLNKDFAAWYDENRPTSGALLVSNVVVVALTVAFGLLHRH